MESDIFRYKKYFSIDVFNKDNYDLLLDTSDLTEEEAYQTVEKFVKEKLESAAVSSL